MGMIPSNQAKFSSPFSGNFQTSAAQSTLSQFYNSFYAKSLTTIDQSLSSPQNYLYNPPMFQNSYNYQQSQEGLLDLQYGNNNCSVKEQSMLVFGGNDQVSCSSSDGSFGNMINGADPMNSLFLDQKANGVMANSQLQYDLEEVKQLISTTGNNFLFNDENKTHERGMYYY
ncbi:hypothetical protein CDL12_23928 [Handroanthus impetiginosus]|nr:hypothetical protein CDL12_23928 [Handroanthus impetiginosus]